MSRYLHTPGSRAHFILPDRVPEVGEGSTANGLTLFVRAWGRDWATTGRDPRFISCGYSSQSTDHRFMLGMTTNDVLRCRIQRNGSVTTLVAPGGTNIPTQSWRTFAAVSSPETLADHLYSNGSQVASSGYGGADLMGDNGTWPVILGNHPGYAQSSSSLYMMDCAIWATALTAQQLLQLEAGVRPGDIEMGHLVGWWPMEDDPPMMVRDWSGRGRHAFHSLATYNGDVTGTAADAYVQSDFRPAGLRPLRSPRRIFLAGPPAQTCGLGGGVEREAAGGAIVAYRATTDDFERADESPIGSPWATARNGGVSLVSGAITDSSNGASGSRHSYRADGEFSDDQQSEIVIGTLTAGTHFASASVRFLSDSPQFTGFGFFTNGNVGSGATSIVRWNANGTSTVLGSPSVGFASGDRLALRATGVSPNITLTGYKNGVPVLTLTGVTGNNSGRPGAGMFALGTITEWTGIALAPLGFAQTATLGGSIERELPGGIVASSGAQLSIGGSAEFDRPGGLVASPGAVSLAIGGSDEASRAGGIAVAAGAVSITAGGIVERERSGGIAAAPGVVTVAPGGTSERERAGGAAAAPGVAIVAAGGAIERERAGGATVGIGLVAVSIGGAADPERPGGIAAAPGAAPVSIGGASETDRPGGLSVAPGAATVAPGGSIERERAGGAAVAIGLATVSIGGSAESERAGGAAAAGGAVSLGIGGHVERELPGGLIAGIGIVVAQIGGTAAPERAGGLIAAPGVSAIGAGGARELEASGGFAARSVVTVGLGGYVEREGVGGIQVSVTVATLAVGGGAERESPGGLAAARLGADVLSIGGAVEMEAAGGARVLVSSDNPGRRYSVPAAARAYPIPAAARVYAVPESTRG